jgi:hypothetical protein
MHDNVHHIKAMEAGNNDIARVYAVISMMLQLDVIILVVDKNAQENAIRHKNQVLYLLRLQWLTLLVYRH